MQQIAGRLKVMNADRMIDWAMFSLGAGSLALALFLTAASLVTDHRLLTLVADKTGYPAYYDLILPRLLVGGLLLIDNVLLRGAVVQPQDERSRLIDDLNNRITADSRVDSVMALVADGLTLVRRR